MTEQSIRNHVFSHIAGFWPGSSVTKERWSRGPIEEGAPELEILTVNPPGATSFIYSTSGCFAIWPEEHIRHEFFMVSPVKHSANTETLTMAAHFHADQRYRLDLGKVVDIGRTWLEGSSCDHLLVSLPYPYGPKLEWLRLPNKVCIRFLWLLPITAREAAFAELHGVESLESKFDSARLDYLNLKRPSVV